ARLRLRGVDECPGVPGLEQPAVMASPADHLGAPGDPLAGLVLDHLGGDEGTEAEPPEPAAELELRPGPAEVLDEPGVRVVGPPEVRAADPGPDHLGLSRDLQLVHGMEGRLLRAVALRPVEPGLTVAHRRANLHLAQWMWRFAPKSRISGQRRIASSAEITWPTEP